MTKLMLYAKLRRLRYIIRNSPHFFMNDNTEQFLQDYFKDRIGYKGDLKPVLDQVCRDYDIGKLIDYEVNRFGYQDYNIEIETAKGNFFVKILAKSRSDKNCRDYIDLMKIVKNHGVTYPSLYKSNQDYLHFLQVGSVKLRLCVQEYIDGDNFAILNIDPDFKEIFEILRQAALINSIKYQSSYSDRDTWATRNFLEQYPVKSKALNKAEKKLVTPLLDDFKNLEINKLPHCLVHGDITRTNVMRDKSNKIWVIDFGVSAYQPRIIELAVLFHDICIDLENHDNTRKKRELALNQYSKSIKLTQTELKALPILTKVTHAMYFMSSAYMERILKEPSEETTFWLTRSKKALTNLID